MQPIERTTLSQRVATAIKAFVIDRQLQPGDKLPSERELSEQFQVSRIVVREALRVLSAAGVVSVQQGKGTFVRGFDSKVVSGHLTFGLPNEHLLMMHLLELREILESGAFELVAARATPEDYRKLREIVASMRAAAERGEPTVPADLRFHRAIFEATRNGPLSRLHSVVDEFFRVRGEVFSPTIQFDEPSEVIRHHGAIVDALERGDVNEAKQYLLLAGSTDRTPPIELDSQPAERQGAATQT